MTFVDRLIVIDISQHLFSQSACFLLSTLGTGTPEEEVLIKGIF